MYIQGICTRDRLCSDFGKLRHRMNEYIFIHIYICVYIHLYICALKIFYWAVGLKNFSSSEKKSPKE